MNGQQNGRWQRQWNVKTAKGQRETKLNAVIKWDLCGDKNIILKDLYMYII
jgi:hypothetical protein